MRKPHPARYALVVLVLALAATKATTAKPLTYALPAETASLKESPGNGYRTTVGMCTACHSADYITTQPAGKGRDFWTAEVNKMIKVYGAPIDQADTAPIIDYLSENY